MKCFVILKLVLRFKCNFDGRSEVNDVEEDECEGYEFCLELLMLVGFVYCFL